MTKIILKNDNDEKIEEWVDNTVPNLDDLIDFEGTVYEVYSKIFCLESGKESWWLLHGIEFKQIKES